jgi:hypothetical protein
MIAYFLLGLPLEELTEFSTRLLKYECQIESRHQILTETDCFSCASIRVLVLLVQQNDTGNSLTAEAEIVLDTFYSI